MKRNTRVKGILALLLLLICVMAMPGTLQAAKLNKKSITLLQGKSYTLKVKGTRKKVVWKASKKMVRIMKRGRFAAKVKALKVGRTTISARIGRKIYRCRVRVVNPTISKKEITLIVGSSCTLQVKNGTGKIGWKSSNEDIASVNSGKISAKKAGSVVITAVQNKKKLICKVTVKARSSGGSGGTAEEGETGTPETPGKTPKKVWVVTKEAWVEYIPIYEKEYGLECTGCGERFSLSICGTENFLDLYTEHENKHMDNNEPGGYRTVIISETYIETKVIEHPEEGYWITVYE